MSKVAEEISNIKKELPAGVRLVAVSKFHPVSLIREAYDAGQRIFGESRVQELLQKIPQLPEDIRWHFIGHLQTNKIRQIIGKVSMIESVDSIRLLQLIDKESEKAGMISDVLLQIHVALEETKFGFSEEEFIDFFRHKQYLEFNSVRIRGVMGMATNTDDRSHIRSDFKKIYQLFRFVNEDSEYNLPCFDTISMGMSDDWKIAVEEGSNLIRIGSGIFGARN